MAITGIQEINIGLPNESIGSDSLYTAFNKSKDNFAQLFACASPYNTFTGNGVTITSTSSTGTVNIDTNVSDIAAGPGILVESANGVFTITNTGGSNGGGSVVSVGLDSSTLAISNSPITTAGSMVVNLQALNPTPAGTFSNPEVTVDQFGRVTSIANGTTSGTVTSVAVTPGTGIQVTGSPITTSGTINIVNTGVTRLSAGSGIVLSGSNGAVTISTISSGGGLGTVTNVAVSSNALVVTGSPITSSGIISVDLPANITATGNLVGGNITTAGNLTANTSLNAGITSTNNTYTQADGDYGLAEWVTDQITIGPASSEMLASLAALTVGQTFTMISDPGSGDVTYTLTVAGLWAGASLTVTQNAPVDHQTASSFTITTITTSLAANTSNVTIQSATTISNTLSASGNINTGANLIASSNVVGGNLITTGYITSSGSTFGVGYATGAGGTVTQGTSRTTGVTIHNISGAITLFTAAGTSAYTTFTVTNSTVAATDVIIVNQKSGTDKYETFVTKVATGSFNITFSDTSGTTSEAPVFNFAVIKAVAS